MKKTMHILSVVIILFIMSFLSGCGNSEPVQASLSIQETSWSEQGSSTYDPRIITPLQKGDVVYDGHFVKIKVKSVNESRIVLTIEGPMVEPNDDGTINLDAKRVWDVPMIFGIGYHQSITDLIGINYMLMWNFNDSNALRYNVYYNPLVRISFVF